MLVVVVEGCPSCLPSLSEAQVVVHPILSNAFSISIPVSILQVADFGLSLSLGSAHPVGEDGKKHFSGVRHGTPLYIAPEVLEKGHLSKVRPDGLSETEPAPPPFKCVTPKWVRRFVSLPM